MNESTSDKPYLEQMRAAFHVALRKNLLTVSSQGIPSNSDKSSKLSVAIGKGVIDALGNVQVSDRLVAQTSGNKFEEVVASYIQSAFLCLSHLRPGRWTIKKGMKRDSSLGRFEQYKHLRYLESAAVDDSELAAAMGKDYIITPDVVVYRSPEPDDAINTDSLNYLGETQDLCNYADLRRVNGGQDILHASISCKWTMRSDRAQNSRTEALNLIRNRKGRLPHIMVVTAEPLPSRLASIALGTGDVDCVYHFALNEMLRVAQAMRDEEAYNLLKIMVDGKRLKDIADLPLDLAI